MAANSTLEDFFFLDIDSITPDEAEVIAAEVFEFGAAGTEERLHFQQGGRHYEPTQVMPDVTALRVYFTSEPPNELLDLLKNNYPDAILRVTKEKNKDWLEEWKKGYAPFELCRSVWVVPSWCEVPKQAQKVIRIDPGMAFGTGTHETTRLAASFIADFAPNQKKTVTSQTLFDVGTGTGILAFLAALLGFEKVAGNDIDPIACEVAMENAELNNFKNMQFNESSISTTKEKYDWVVANIIDGVLCDMQQSLKQAVKSGGHLLLTGILNEREPVFRKEFSFDGFEILERRQLGEWVGYLLKKAEE